jgi:hypothetical protein
MASPEGGRRPQQRRPTEQTKPQLESGNGVPGLPPDSRAYPTLPQKSALNRAVEKTRDLYERNVWVFIPLGELGKSSPGLPINPAQEEPQTQQESTVNTFRLPLFEEAQNRGKMSDSGIDKVSRDVDHPGEDETMPKVTSANVEQFLQELEKQDQSQQELKSQERERQEIEASIRNLKQLRTMRQRISAAQDLTQEQLDKLRQHDPGFTEPIITGLNKRPYRIMKAGTLLHRMTKGDMSPARKPNYNLLMKRVVLSFEAYPAEHEDFLKKTSRKDKRRILEAELELSFSTASIGREGKSELAGVQNALVCAHDLMRSYREVGVEPPKPLRQLYRRLEKRRDYLSPNPTKGSGL